MTPEFWAILTVGISVIGVVATLGTMLLTGIRRMEARLSARMDRLDARMDRLDARMDRLEARMDALAAALAALGERVARIEGVIEGRGNGSSFSQVPPRRDPSPA